MNKLKLSLSLLLYFYACICVLKGETGVDLAGLGRELGSLTMNGLCQSHFFQGTGGKMTLAKSQDELEEGGFRALGMVLAMHAVYNGVAVQFLMEPLKELLLLGEINSNTFNVEDIPDVEVQNNLKTVSNLTPM